MKIVSVVGARPNFMKIAPFIEEIVRYNDHHNVKLEHLLVHTGQHYDDRMSKKFFESLGIPDADINLGIGSGTHAEQVGETMIAFEKVLKAQKPDWVVVVGDVNATLACSVTAKKELIKCCHIEAGLRSGDISMPEEINRLVTDRLSDLLLTPDKKSSQNLLNEGIDPRKIKFVGNIMIDTLEKQRSRAGGLKPKDIVAENILVPSKAIPDLMPEKYGLITLHRPSNVDNPEILTQLISFIIDEAANSYQLIWPIHPRTLKQLQSFSLYERVVNAKNLILLYPIGYHEMLRLNMEAKFILTDSGGLQEECTILGTPCLTLRSNTERPITLREFGGASILTGNSIESIRTAFYDLVHQVRTPMRPELWDGKSASRCLESILNFSQ